MRGPGYPIGEASRATGVKVPTIRYYEDIGLISAPSRSAGNRRLYDTDDLRRLAFIRHARELGFDVEAIRTLLALQDRPSQSCAEVDARIVRLTALKAELEEMVAQCARGRIDTCRVIETLADGGHVHGRLAEV